MTYSEKLKDPRWQKKKNKILDRDDYTCSYCGNQDHTLHVHHLYYRKDREPWEYPDTSLITLCDDCHELMRNIDVIGFLLDYIFHGYDLNELQRVWSGMNRKNREIYGFDPIPLINLVHEYEDPEGFIFELLSVSKYLDQKFIIHNV